MGKVLLAFIIMIVSLPADAQEVFIDTITKNRSVFVGLLNQDRDSMRVIENKIPIWKAVKDVEQQDLLSGKKFLSFLQINRLCFKMEGYEPFWQAFISGEEILFFDTESGEQEQFGIDIYTNDSDVDPMFCMMFKSSDNSVFGVINYVGMNYLEQRCCEYELSENISLYEVYLCKDDKIYRGCAEIEPDKDEFIEGFEEWGCGNNTIKYIPFRLKDDLRLILVNMDCGDFSYRYYLLAIKNNKIVSNLYVEGEWYEEDNNKEITSFEMDEDFIITVTTTWEKEDFMGTGGIKSYCILTDGEIVELKK